MSGVSRRIIGHSGIYLLGSLLARAVSFIMLPIYTRSLTPADYGVIELLSMTIDLVGLLLSLRIGQSIYRYYHKYELEDERKQVLFSSYVMTMATSLLGMLVVLIFSEKLALAVFGDVHLAGILRLFSLTMLFQGLVETPMVMFRAQQKPWQYLAASIVKLTLMLSLNIYFVVFKRMHVEGVIFSALISGAVMALILSMILLRTTGFSFSIAKAREMMRFSFPFAAIGALSFYLNFGDRYFLRLYGGGLNEVGIYSLGYKFGFLLIFLAGDPFSNMWDSEKFRIYREHENPAAVYRRVFLVYTAVLAMVFLGLSLFGRNAILIMANRDFWRAADLIPIVCMAYVFNCMEGFVNLGLLIKERTLELSYGTVFAGAVVTAGYFVLIPRFGVMGAAWATLLAFAARMIWNVRNASKYLDMKLEWGKVIGIWAIACMVLMLTDFLQVDSLYLSVIMNIVAVMAFLCSLLYLPLLPEDVRIAIRKWLLNPRSSLRSLKGVLGTG